MTNRPTLNRWITGAHPDHPLLPLMGDTQADELLDGFEVMLTSLEEANPARLSEKIKDFAANRTFKTVLDMRAELLVAHRLAEQGIEFEFGDTRKPNPDILVNQGNLGIEVTARRPDGTRILVEALEEALTPYEGLSLVLTYTTYPHRIQSDVREAFVEQGTDLLRDGAGPGAKHSMTFLDSNNGGEVTITAHIQAAEDEQIRVQEKVDSTELTGTFDIVKNALTLAWNDKAKTKQAESVPSILVVDAAMLGAAPMRSLEMTAKILGAHFPPDCPFKAMAVMFPSLDTLDVSFAFALHPSLDEAEAAPIHSLMAKLTDTVTQVTVEP